MPDDKIPGQPKAASLDGAFDELRSLLSNLPASPAAEPEHTEPVAPPAPVEFHVVTPAPSADEAPMPPIPTAIESSSESWTMTQDSAADSVPPPVSDSAPPASSWLQPEAGIAQEPDQAPEPAAVEAPAPVDDFMPPIPGTREAPDIAPVEAPDLDLDVTEAKPENLIQIACLFPEGEEKKGQAFVTRLREAAARLKKPLTVQAVFLHNWSADAVNVTAWAKSASLSGADAVFVIAPKASVPLFASLRAEAAATGAVGRVLAAEQIASPALYADILVEIKRKANGAR